MCENVCPTSVITMSACLLLVGYKKKQRVGSVFGWVLILCIYFISLLQPHFVLFYSCNNSHSAAASVAANDDLVIYYRCLVSCPFFSAELCTSMVCALGSLFRLACWAEVVMCVCLLVSCCSF